MKITFAEQPTLIETSTAVGKPGAQQVQQETILQLKYVNGKMTSNYVSKINSSLVNLLHLVQYKDVDMCQVSNLVGQYIIK